MLLLLLAQLADPRQHLQPRDFLPADVSELSSVVVVELCCGVGVGVVVIVGGCRQHVVADDFGFVAADTTFAVVVVVVDSGEEEEERKKISLKRDHHRRRRRKTLPGMCGRSR